MSKISNEVWIPEVEVDKLSNGIVKVIMVFGFAGFG